MNEGRSELDFLKWKLSVVEEENSRLKAKLEKKRIPPKGTPVRDKDTGRVYYSFGRLSNAEILLVTYRPSYSCDDNADTAISNWEEIEIKVKG